MAKKNAINLSATNNADGFDASGGTTARKLTVSGADIALAGSGSAVLTFPASTATIASLGLDETFGGLKTFTPGFISSLNTVVTSQFDKTADTTLANVTGLSATVVAAKTYTFEAVLFTSSNVAGGVKAAIAGTATATSIIYESIVLQTGTTIASTASRSTALAGAVANVTTVTVATLVIRGTIVVNAGGTLTVQFAQNASNGAASSVLINSFFKIERMN